MKSKEKILTALALTTAATATITLINKYLFYSATKDAVLTDPNSHTYNWRYGTIYYTKQGTGNPILLVHNLDNISSDYEWNKIIEPLSKSHTVYTIDLLGCGKSEKPDFTYTNFVFVQLINDFVKNIIGQRTDIMTLGYSSSIALMACVYNAELFNKLIFISPESILESVQVPTRFSKIRRTILDLPIIGTLVYNIAHSKKMIREELIEKKVYTRNAITNKDIYYFHHNSHLGGANAKSLYSSIKNSYTKINITNALKEINHSIFIVGGEYDDSYHDTVKQYKMYNPAVESITLPKCKKLIPLEVPNYILNILKMI